MFPVGVGNEVVDVCITKIIIEIEFLLSDVLSDSYCKKKNFAVILICLQKHKFSLIICVALSSMLRSLNFRGYIVLLKKIPHLSFNIN